VELKQGASTVKDERASREASSLRRHGAIDAASQGKVGHSTPHLALCAGGGGIR
jgi:hypothetical protein